VAAAGSAPGISMTLDELMAARPWTPIRNCPGRYVLPATPETPASLAGRDVPIRLYRVAAARDDVVVVQIVGGGIISYRRADGRYVHTLNTPEGFARKLEQLGIAG
jgi:hypothetical protein